MRRIKLWLSNSRRRASEWWEKVDDLKGDTKPTGVDTQKGDQMPVDHRISPNFADIGCRGSYFFLSASSQYLKRHVETLQIKSSTFARRRLTIDVQLPSDATLGKSSDNGEVEFWIPVTFLAKRPSRSNIDLQDDRGQVVPLLTRSENNEISLAAILAGAEELLPSAPSLLLKALLAETINCDGVNGEIPMALAKEALKAEGADLEGEKGRAFAESLRVLSGNYAMWVGFHGRSGERRVVKFHYNVEFDRQRLWRQRPTTHNFLIFGRQTEVTCKLSLDERGDENPYSWIRRLAARVASSTGLGAVNIGIQSPYILGSDSYHLQVESPPGVETRDIDLFALLEEGADAKKWARDHGAHLYVSRARFAQDSVRLALLTLRIGRRGFMTLAWLSALLSTTILWLFDLTARSKFESREATAAVLLLGPALLAALVVRPGEHPVATKLFSGIRLLVALNGILVVAAAAAVAGARPEGWTPEHTWFIYAIVASGSAAVVSLSWIFSWDITFKLVKGLRRQLSTGEAYRRLCAWLFALTAIVLVLGSIDSWSPIAPAVYLAPLAGLAVACGFVAAGYAGLQSKPTLPAAVFVSFTGLAALAGVATLVLHLTGGWAWDGWWLKLAVVPLVGLVSLWVNNRLWKRRKRKQAEAPPEAEESDGGRRWLPDADTPGIQWLKQTPSGALVQQQARENATGVPDLVAPSAYREMEFSEELKEKAKPIYEKFRQAWVEKEGLERESGPDDSGETEHQARERAKEDGRRKFICLDL